MHNLSLEVYLKVDQTLFPANLCYFITPSTSGCLCSQGYGNGLLEAREFFRGNIVFSRHVSIEKFGFRFWKSDFRSCNETQNPKSDFIFVEIQPQGGFQLRYPKLDFMVFVLYHFIGKSKKGFGKLFSGTVVFLCLLCVCVLGCFSWERRLSFSNPFSYFPIRLKETGGNPRTDFPRFTSVLGLHISLKIICPDFKIYKIQIF